MSKSNKKEAEAPNKSKVPDLVAKYPNVKHTRWAEDLGVSPTTFKGWLIGKAIGDTHHWVTDTVTALLAVPQDEVEAVTESINKERAIEKWIEVGNALGQIRRGTAKRVFAQLGREALGTVLQNVELADALYGIIVEKKYSASSINEPIKFEKEGESERT